ncbi:ribonuclease H-like domain-containing protein [Crucibulum laeve]|uniref:RNA exonuclease 4 n=1 Tax=Crucibulum laeve TaxID=68775 RepID=A0A5C3LXR5_9AGAR|nr:ribonuclease H-like domain-containing protein [Crucibulum laeve]
MSKPLITEPIASSKKKGKAKADALKAKPSSNWLQLQKTLTPKRKPFSYSNSTTDTSRNTKRQKIAHQDERSPSPEPARRSYAARALDTSTNMPVDGEEATENVLKNGESLSALRRMVDGKMVYTDNQKLPGKYLSLDCEMVGVGPEGAESSLARVSLVNFYGYVQLDVFVRQRERVVDYRTQWSGVRESDMVGAKPFEEVQKQVATLLEDRILVGHAVHNDLKALLLSHPRPLTRDTQYYAHKFELVKSRRPALRLLVQQELGIKIQEGEHSSVADARATMAVYRLHRKEWDKAAPRLPSIKSAPGIPSSKKRKTTDNDSDFDSDSDISPTVKASIPTPSVSSAKQKSKSKSTSFPGGGRKGVSSGLTTVLKHGAASSWNSAGGRKVSTGDGEKSAWWKELPSGGGGKRSKGSIVV